MTKSSSSGGKGVVSVEEGAEGTRVGVGGGGEKAASDDDDEALLTQMSIGSAGDGAEEEGANGGEVVQGQGFGCVDVAGPGTGASAAVRRGGGGYGGMDADESGAIVGAGDGAEWTSSVLNSAVPHRRCMGQGVHSPGRESSRNGSLTHEHASTSPGVSPPAGQDVSGTGGGAKVSLTNRQRRHIESEQPGRGVCGISSAASWPGSLTDASLTNASLPPLVHVAGVTRERVRSGFVDPAATVPQDAVAHAGGVRKGEDGQGMAGKGGGGGGLADGDGDSSRTKDMSPVPAGGGSSQMVPVSAGCSGSLTHEQASTSPGVSPQAGAGGSGSSGSGLSGVDVNVVLVSGSEAAGQGVRGGVWPNVLC